MGNLEETVLQKIDEMKDEIVDFHQKIIQIPSENPPGKYNEVVKFTETKMKEIGLKTKIKRRNVIGELGENEKKTIIFNAHYDTVEAFENWTKDPFGGEIEHGKIYGRGSSDDKSCVTAEIFATKALKETGVDLNGKLIVTATGDEELGGLSGVKYLLSSGLIKGNVCLLGDGPPDYPYGHTGGTFYITFVIRGKSGHGLGNPDLPDKYHNQYSGINAIERMVKIMSFLMQLNEEFLTNETQYKLAEGATTKVSHINLAEIHGGNKISIVPGRCYLHCSVNTIPEQSIESIKTRILDFVEEMKKQDRLLDISVMIPISLEPVVIDGKSDFAKAVQKSMRTIFEEEREFRLFMPSTDAHWFQERGIETILIGTSRIDNNIHNTDEFVLIDDLINTTKVYALTALNYLT
ncbi:MAG: M20 family metallopeptidase [Candidatus Heimdallarchaeota archaeon]